MILIVLFTIFPVAVTIRTSILNIPENYLQLLSTYTDDKWIVFKYLILPSLVPPLLSTTKILSTASIVATIITELPLSVRNGIGKDIYNSFNNQMIPRVWVSVITISILSLIFFTILDNLETYLNKNYRYGQY
jgi:ABC-type nitrate/sulfonate/bicarbonate transport system permease component